MSCLRNVWEILRSPSRKVIVFLSQLRYGKVELKTLCEFVMNDRTCLAILGIAHPLCLHFLFHPLHNLLQPHYHYHYYYYYYHYYHYHYCYCTFTTTTTLSHYATLSYTILLVH